MIYEKKMNGDAIETTSTTDLDQESHKIFKTEKIRIYPNNIQTEIFTKWLNCIKETYNHLVEKWSSCENPPSKKIAREFMKSLPCCIGIPTDIIDCAMQDLLTAAQAAKSKKGNNRDYSATFKARESITQCGIVIRPEQWITHGKKNRPIDDGYGFFGPDDDSFGEHILRSKYELPRCLSHSCRIKQDVKGRWFVYLHVDQHVVTKIPTGCDIDHAVALDPGIRTFMTTYSCDGVVTEWAVNDSKRIHGLHLKADKLQSLIDCNKGKGMLRCNYLFELCSIELFILIVF
jgi:transposase